MAFVLISEVSVRNYDTYSKFNNKQGDFPAANSPVAKEYVRHIHSLFDVYRKGVGANTNEVNGARVVIETNTLFDTKFKAWKRNADIINSLLALPQGMNNAGR
ncbi:uncharacterized protein LOC113237143 [Hyposmocoma kahamanoa]|uniref:uncharacterized protein LOC113237143 n=1 Tax=Hyposmocoma kahamanoa TaxID=1477025 RepID=UPI000E6D8C8D|nr:uncharacterized protein LOC113237143 [Hyposmocoma kahamanoa]